MSHSISLKTLRGANFLRFGNEEFVFNFYDGVIGLMGENGLGKSAILDAVCICLFNETYRASTQADWTNNINEKGLYLSLLLETHGATVDTYLIVRKPTSRKTAEKLMIYKNDVLLTGVPDYQEYIENTILGFGVNIFKNTIAVSGGTPFISMTPDQKRKFSENLFSIKQVRDYKKKVNERLSESQLSKRIVAQEILTATNKITEYTNFINMANSNIEAEIAEVDEQIRIIEETQNTSRDSIAVLNSEMLVFKDKIVEAEREGELLRQKLIELDATALYTSIAKVNAELEVCKRDYKKEMAEITRIAPNVICTQCGNSFSEEQAETHKKIHEEASKEIAAKGRELRAELDRLSALLPTIDNINAAIATIRNEISAYNLEISKRNSAVYSTASYINTLDQSKYSYKVKKTKLLEKPEESDVKAFAVKSIDEANTLISQKNDELALLDRKIKAYNYIIEMCSDDGIKRMLLREFMPVLNKLIAFYLDRFDLPVTVEFDEYFNHTLGSPKGLGQKHSMMSKGQKTRINLAILFAMVDLVKRIGNVKCNTLMLDEFADEGLDAKGFAAAVDSIRKVADKDNKSIVLITHKQEDILYDNLDALYELELKNQFSVLKEVKSF
jgi:DNA repair exonuclease SbcCD ATPase subunit